MSKYFPIDCVKMRKCRMCLCEFPKTTFLWFSDNMVGYKIFDAHSKMGYCEWNNKHKKRETRYCR